MNLHPSEFQPVNCFIYLYRRMVQNGNLEHLTCWGILQRAHPLYSPLAPQPHVRKETEPCPGCPGSGKPGASTFVGARASPLLGTGHREIPP